MTIAYLFFIFFILSFELCFATQYPRGASAFNNNNIILTLCGAVLSEYSGGYSRKFYSFSFILP